MGAPFRVALVGEHNESVPAHRAIPVALGLSARALEIDMAPIWLATDAIDSAQALHGFEGVWCVPASPYRSMAGALLAIEWARRAGVPFLGTCGGFQHAVIEHARNVLGWADAEHAETSPEAQRPVIAPLACSLVEVQETLRLLAGSRLAKAYGSDTAHETYRCRYGLNPAFAQQLLAGPLKAVAHDSEGEVRAVELENHPFFSATLFQPERSALAGVVPPLVLAFVVAMRDARVG